MSQPIVVVTEGHGIVCLECIFLDPHMKNQGHPHPCWQFRWVGDRHIKPDMETDGKACASFTQHRKGLCNVDSVEKMARSRPS